MEEKIKSPLIDLGVVSEEVADETAYINYPQFLEKILRETEKANKENGNKITIDYVTNVETGETLFETVTGPKSKVTLRMGNENALRKILFIGGTHGTESRMATAILQAVLELAKPGEAREELLANNLIIFDPVADIFGFNNQTWGTVSRDGRQVNAPVITGVHGHSKQVNNPWGLEDRNAAQGRNSQETLDPLSRSNQAHYKKVGKCDKFFFVLDLHETNELSNYPDFFYRNAGVMMIVKFLCSAQKLSLAQRLPSELSGSSLTKILRKVLRTNQPKFSEDVFAFNPDLIKFRLIRDRIRALGERTYEKDYEKIEQMMSFIKQYIRLGESIYTMGEIYEKANVLCTPEALGHKGMTTETFQQDLAVRIRQSLAAIEAVLWIEGLGKWEVGK